METAKRARKAETPKQPSPYLRLRAPYLYPDPYRQLPEVGRLAYPGRAAATKHERPGRKSPSCPAAEIAAVGTIRGASKLGGRNITKYLQPRKHALREVVRRIDAGSRPFPSMGKADDTVEETGASTRCTAGAWGPASKDRLSE
jgi:hypothetical protein